MRLHVTPAILDAHGMHRLCLQFASTFRFVTWKRSGFVAGTLEEGGPLAPLRPLLPTVCHMAVCETSAALVPGVAAGPQEQGWGEEALVAALTAVRVCRMSHPFSAAIPHREYLPFRTKRAAGPMLAARWLCLHPACHWHQTGCKAAV